MSKKFVLYTIPFAGGSSLSYAGWNKYLSSDIELMNLDYSGHGKRIGEGLISNFDDVVSDILNQIKDSLNNRKFLITATVWAEWWHITPHTFCRINFI